MKNKAALLAAITLLLIAACKKPNDQFSGVKVHYRTHLLGGLMETYSYDGSSGYVTQIQYSTGDKSLYTYSNDTVLMQYVIGGSVVSNGTMYILNGDKQAVTTTGLYQSQNNSNTTAFNSDGQPTQQKFYVQGALNYTLDYSITNKNVLTIVNTNAGTGSHINSQFVFTSATQTNTIGNQNFGMGYLGVGNLNIPNTQVQLNDNNDTVGIIRYRYHFDSGGNIDTLATYDRNGHVLDSLAYSYY